GAPLPRRRARRSGVGLAPARYVPCGTRARWLDQRGARGAPGAARPAASDGHAVRARGSAPRRDRRGGTLPLGVSGRCERRGISGPGGGIGGLVVGAGSREREAVRSGDIRDTERDAAPVALDRKG